jgi:hypothetical protein
LSVFENSNEEANARHICRGLILNLSPATRHFRFIAKSQEVDLAPLNIWPKVCATDPEVLFYLKLTMLLLGKYRDE